ncbi:MAG: phenylacetic acid degradation protein PaaD [Rhodospirillaceae bacterium]|nr:phenylacetic acid degradation protein PaaD [Rhodospirillaceae bacterium]|tara:strand:+ start:3403 stop:3828 length:426 start_codon:yes stop_codon:yes gene_type:complete
MKPKERAEKSATAMWQNDNSSQWIGVKIDEVDEGKATLLLTVKKHHTNGHNLCHGGIIFTLADSAFAFACNSRNQATVAQHNTITYIRPAVLNDELTARAREVSLVGKNGIYDVTVANQHKLVIAEFRGYSRAIRGRLFDE